MKIAAATILLLLASVASAGTLLRPNGVATVDKEQPLELDAARLADLRGRHSAVVESFPLGRDGTATVALHRIAPFSPTLRIEVDGPSGVETLPLPDATYFGGTIVGEARSLVLLIASDTVRGFVVRGDQTYPFGPDRQGMLRSYALRDVDPAEAPGPSDFCANDLHPGRQFTIPLPHAPAMATPPATAQSTTLLEAQVAVDTDVELVGSNTVAATTYLTALFAAANVIYERDVHLRLKLNYLRLRTGSDPWTKSNTLGALEELEEYWRDPANGMPNATNDIVHLVSGKGPSGGVAYVQAACNDTYHFGVSQVNGGFDVSDPHGIWDVLVFTHEVGHNMGSDHTHCYDPPLDHCYSGESAMCYNGPTSLPAGGGTVMSYCHLLPGGLSNVDLLFGDTVSGTIRSFAENVSCLSVGTACGDGNLDDDEQCDDGNTASGDGCSSNCESEGTCGDGITGAGEECDDGNTVGGDSCSVACRFEECGNHYVDVGEGCDDGNPVSGDGCSSTCVDEPLCGDGEIDPNEECDDGNVDAGDGCSGTCMSEPCQIVVPHQATWAPARVVATPGAFAVRGRFGVPSGALDLAAVADEGVHVLVDGATGVRSLDVTVPGGPAWSIGAARVRYRDPSGSASGVRSIVIRARGNGVSTVDLKIASHGGAVPDVNDAPPTVTVLLGDDETAGEVGACGRYAFSGGRCVKRGKKLTCK